MYEVYYDIAKDSFSWVHFLVGPGILLVCILAYLRRPRELGSFIGFGIALVVAAAFTWGVLEAWFQFRDARRSAASDSCRVIEGAVRDFEPMPPGGHRDERFSVGGTRFSYSHFSLIAVGFEQDTTVGGPIREGLNVRICYWQNSRGENHIVRLEIRND